MTQFRLALVEDSEEDIQICKDSVARYRDEKQRDIQLTEYRSVEDALQKLDNSFDGAIVDLKFDRQGDEGYQVVTRITKSSLRIPIAIVTGTPADADMTFDYVGVFKKGEWEYVDIFDIFWEIHDSGLTRIVGGRGKIEETLESVFRTNILQQRSIWINYGKLDSARTERALLRHILNHLLQLLDDDDEPCYPEEVYICPPLSADLKTGSIVEKKGDKSFFVVLNPACDLVVRPNGQFKTDRVLLVEIEPAQAILAEVLTGISTNEKKGKKLKPVLGNNYTTYHHWLPETNFFPGGFLNFRKLTTLGKDDFGEIYNSPVVQISPYFVKDIVGRFSSYYARQGQPDIDVSLIINQIINPPQDKL